MYKLRELQKQDIPIINEWRNNIELIDFLGAPYRYINLDIDYKWFDNYLINRSNTVRCAIVDVSKRDEVFGLVSLTNINYVNQSAVFHIMIGDINNRGKGIGYYAITEILNHAFNNMNLNRIELSVLESNMKALKLYENVGFKIEGVKRKSIFKNGEFKDMIIMGILRDEFLK